MLPLRHRERQIGGHPMIALASLHALFFQLEFRTEALIGVAQQQLLVKTALGLERFGQHGLGFVLLSQLYEHRRPQECDLGKERGLLDWRAPGWLCRRLRGSYRLGSLLADHRQVAKQLILRSAE